MAPKTNIFQFVCVWRAVIVLKFTTLACCVGIQRESVSFFGHLKGWSPEFLDVGVKSSILSTKYVVIFFHSTNSLLIPADSERDSDAI